MRSHRASRHAYVAQGPGVRGGRDPASVQHDPRTSPARRPRSTGAPAATCRLSSSTRHIGSACACSAGPSTRPTTRKPGRRGHPGPHPGAASAAAAIVLMHDGGGDRSQTVAQLPGLIDRLRAAGYSLGRCRRASWRPRASRSARRAVRVPLRASRGGATATTVIGSVERRQRDGLAGEVGRVVGRANVARQFEQRERVRCVGGRRRRARSGDHHRRRGRRATAVEAGAVAEHGAAARGRDARRRSAARRRRRGRGRTPWPGRCGAARRRRRPSAFRTCSRRPAGEVDCAVAEKVQRPHGAARPTLDELARQDRTARSHPARAEHRARPGRRRRAPGAGPAGSCRAGPRRCVTPGTP